MVRYGEEGGGIAPGYDTSHPHILTSRFHFVSVSSFVGPDRPFKEIYLNGKELCEIMWSGAFVYTPDGEGESYPLLLDDEVDSMELGDLNHPYDVIMPDLPFPEQVRHWKPVRPGDYFLPSQME